MKSGLYLRIIQDVNEHRYSIDEIRAKFYKEDLHDLMDFLLNTFQESLLELIEKSDFISIYHQLLYNIVDACDELDDLQYISLVINRHLNTIKDYLKPYNKKEKDKDEIYNKLCRLKNDLSGNLTYTDNKSFNVYEYDNVKVINYIIYEMKDIEALKHVIETHKEIVNIYNNDEEHLLTYVIRNFVDNIDTMTLEDIDYFKRVITMIVIRDELKLDYKQKEEIKTDLAFKKEKIQEENQKHIKYVEYIIDKYFMYNQVDNVILNEVTIPKDNLTDRMDLRSMPTITIDYVKYTSGLKMLFDDAFSIQEKEDGTYYLYMHTPDVDEFIPRDQGLDAHMKNMCESRYVKDEKAPMIPYQIAKKISLTKDDERPALTYRIHVNREGKILGINFFKSRIRVDYNLSKTQADILMKDKGFKYHDLLNMMFSICKSLRISRHDTLGKRSPAGIILDEYNIWANIATAQFAEDNGIIFPYKNLIKREEATAYFLQALKEFDGQLDDDAREMLYSIEGTKERNFYSTINYGNARFNNMPYSNCGNPLREYISLDTCRLVKDLMIDNINNTDYWEEKISNDCAELSEASSKVKELYKTSQ